MKKIAVIVAGGSGQRMGSMLPKQFLLLHNKTLLWHSICVFYEAFADIQVVLVLPKEHLEKGKEIAASFTPVYPVLLAEGGATRFHSVQNGLQYVTEESIVFVHDAVRCLLTKELIKRCFEQAVIIGSAIPAVAATDSIRIAENDNTSIAADRIKIRIVQTPQTFKSSIILPAFAQECNARFTDEATVVEALGQPVYLIEGEYNNIKITRPIDMLIAEQILAERSTF